MAILAALHHVTRYSYDREYMLNKTPCRLRDIRDLFYDTGVGSNAYSVIERQMVDNVLTDSRAQGLGRATSFQPAQRARHLGCHLPVQQTHLAA